jgi:hypothetical protein
MRMAGLVMSWPWQEEQLVIKSALPRFSTGVKFVKLTVGTKFFSMPLSNLELTETKELTNSCNASVMRSAVIWVSP